MPCDLGYKVVAKTTVQSPIKKEFKDTIKPPKVDADLLEKIGVDDPNFIAWFQNLDTKPLLIAVLNRILDKFSSNPNLKATINEAGNLVVTSSYQNELERQQLEGLSNQFGDDFQMAMLAVVAQLLGYQTLISKQRIAGEPTLILEAEKHGEDLVSKYIRVTKTSSGKGIIQFEHFSSAAERDLELRKFLAIGQKLGVRIDLDRVLQVGGQPIQKGVEHRHFLKGGQENF